MFAFARMQRQVSRTLIATALLCGGWAAAVACSSSSEPGIEATLLLSSVDDPPLVDSTRRFDTDRGYQVELRHGYLVLEHLELQDCVEDPVIGSLWEPAVALAHTGGNPRRLAAPVFVDLITPPSNTSLGVLKPPAGTYCAFQQSLGPADADTPGAPAEAIGQSLSLAFSVSGGPLGEPRVLEIRSDVVFDGFYALQPMTLDGSHRHVSIKIAHSGAAWFDGIDFATADEERITQKFLRNFRDSVEVSWQ
ncbi:MAG: hypothetical protein R3B07_16935 [Polyangiaceae bacterium]